MRRLVRLLFEPSAAEFRSALTLDEAVRQLSAASSRTVFATLFHEAAVGRVSAQGVFLWRYTPWFANGYKPRFIGHFHGENGSLMLCGKFAVSLPTRIFLACWFGFIVLWTIIALLSALFSPGTPRALPLAGIAFLAVGIGFFSLTKRLRDNDIQWLSQRISEALATGRPPPGR